MRRLGLGGLGTLGLCTFSETVLEATVDVLQVSHSAGAGGVPSDGLETPVVRSQSCVWVSTCGACGLLEVEGRLAAPQAKRVRLVVSLTIGRGTLSPVKREKREGGVGRSKRLVRRKKVYGSGRRGRETVHVL